MGDVTTFRLTYEEWEKRRAAAECNEHGHDWTVTSELGSGEPVNLYCARECGAGPWEIK